jgi:hypothetical protein
MLTPMATSVTCVANERARNRRPLFPFNAQKLLNQNLFTLARDGLPSQATDRLDGCDMKLAGLDVSALARTADSQLGRNDDLNLTAGQAVKQTGVLRRHEQRRSRLQHPRKTLPMGWSWRLVRGAFPQFAVENCGPNLHQEMGAPLSPLHLLLLNHASGHQ